MQGLTLGAHAFNGGPAAAPVAATGPVLQAPLSYHVVGVPTGFISSGSASLPPALDQTAVLSPLEEPQTSAADRQSNWGTKNVRDIDGASWGALDYTVLLYQSVEVVDPWQLYLWIHSD